MAPRSDKNGRGGKKGGSPSRQKGGKDDKNGRGSKKGPGAGKHKSDGGVKKPRPQRGARIDGDGDLDMGANPKERNDKTKGTDRQKDKVRGQASSVLIRVHGLKESNLAHEKNGGVEKLLGWIEKKSQEKAKGKVKIYKVRRKGAGMPLMPPAQSSLIRSSSRVCDIRVHALSILSPTRLGSFYDGSLPPGFVDISRNQLGEIKSR